MIDIRTARNEVSRLMEANLSYPPDKDGATALAKSISKFSSSERHAALVVETWIDTWPQFPKPSDIRQQCETIKDPTYEAIQRTREDCNRCGGTGWISVDGPFGTSAAYHCSHQPESEQDRRMGVRISPALARHYGALDAAAEPERDRWVGSGGKPLAATVARIMADV
jgi:hypothetical protein